jgi:hypothetical protein
MLDSRFALDYTGKKLSSGEVQAVASELEHEPVELLLLARTGLDDSKSELLSKGLRNNKCAFTFKALSLLFMLCACTDHLLYIDACATGL